MLRRVARLLAVVALAGAAAVGCAGSPAPTDTTPAPLTDEEAFAAAEETYRAYVDALNEVDLSDPETFEPVYALTTGDLNAEDRRNFSEWQAESLQIRGDAEIEQIVHVAVDRTEEAPHVVLETCYDVSGVDVLAPDGTSLVDAGRPAIQPLRVTALLAGSSTDARIASIEPARDLTC